MAFSANTFSGLPTLLEPGLRKYLCELLKQYGCTSGVSLFTTVDFMTDTFAVRLRKGNRSVQFAVTRELLENCYSEEVFYELLRHKLEVSVEKLMDDDGADAMSAHSVHNIDSYLSQTQLDYYGSPAEGKYPKVFTPTKPMIVKGAFNQLLGPGLKKMMDANSFKAEAQVAYAQLKSGVFDYSVGVPNSTKKFDSKLGFQVSEMPDGVLIPKGMLSVVS